MELLQDAILKYIAEQDIAHPKDILDKFEKPYGYNTVNKTLSLLESYGLVRKASHRMVSVILTQKGIKAVEMGFEGYLNQLDKEEHLDEKIKKTTLFSDYISIGKLMYTIIILLIGILLKTPIIQLLKSIRDLF